MTQHPLVLGLTLTVLASGALAHDDDPKILHQLPPVTGPGYVGQSPLPASAASGLGFDASGVQLMAWVPLNLIDGASAANDCWGYVSPGGREYAILCTRDGTAFFDITVPTNPVQIGYVGGTSGIWRDAKTFGNHCYIVSEQGDDLQVVDLTNVDSGFVTLVNTVDTVGGASSHNVAINEDSGYLYLCGGSGNGVRIYDLNVNPVNPPHVATWSTRYVHDAQIVSYTSGPEAGREIAFLCAGLNGGWNDGDLTILDVTDKSNIFIASQVSWPGVEYSHQGWLSEDRQYFYMGDEIDEDGVIPSTTYVLDVSDVDNATYVGQFGNGEVAVTHNLYTHQGRIFAANYTSGLRIFDTTASATNPPEVAYFDTYQANDAATFNGLWSVYPYLPSGVVIGSDVQGGLFILNPSDPEMTMAVAGTPPTMLDPAGDSVDVLISESLPGLLDTSSPTLHVDQGVGFQTYPLVFVSGDTWRADFPQMTCGATVEWFVSASGVSGFSYQDPFDAPGSVFSSLAANGVTAVFDDPAESPAGWSVGAPGDTATTGIWEQGDPLPTASQTDFDHTSGGTECWFTGQGTVGGTLGENDVDGGSTTLLSPVLDLSGLSQPTISYWRWFSNDGNGNVDDVFVVDITFDGTNWVNVETLGPIGPQTSGGWFEHVFLAADFGTPSANTRLRFVATDASPGSIVEAAIDDLSVSDLACAPPELGTRYCSPAPVNTTGLPGKLDLIGSDVLADQSLTLVASDLPPNEFGFFLVSQTQGLLLNPGGSMGNLCLGGDIGRYQTQVQSSGAAGTISIAVDLMAIPVNPPQAAMVGETWNFQAWHRDVVLVPTSNFTDAVAITFQ